MPCNFSVDPVCIPPAYAAVAQDVYGLRAGDPPEPDAKLQARVGAKVVNLYSDQILHISARSMSHNCTDNLCVHYARYCEATKLTCRFVIGVEANPPLADFRFTPREFIVVADTQDGLKAADLAIEIGRPSGALTIRLGQLTQEISKDDLEKVSAWHLE